MGISLSMRLLFGVSNQKGKIVFSPGRTLIEVIIALCVSLILGGIFFQGVQRVVLLRSYISRGHNMEVKVSHVFSIMMPQILNAGQGIPASLDFEKLFEEVSSIAHWGRALNVVPNFDAEIMNKDWGNELRCVYTLPSLLKVISIAPSLQEVTLSGVPKSSKVEPTYGGKARKTLNWVVFPGATRPFRVAYISGTKVKLAESAQDVESIPIGSFLHFLRASRFYVKRGPREGMDALYFHDVTKQSAQPVVNGISRMEFTYHKQEGVLEVCIEIESRGKRSKVVTAFHARNI